MTSGAQNMNLSAAENSPKQMLYLLKLRRPAVLGTY